MDNLRDIARPMALGLVSSYTIGGYIHLLLVVALVIPLINIIQGNRSVV